MSATGRNLEGNERRADDHYATPGWVTLSVLRYLRFEPWPTLDHGCVLDPCCGEGAILDVVKSEWGAGGVGIEIDVARAIEAAKKGHEVHTRDALGAVLFWPSVDVLITNPPYGLAMEFIEKALAEYGKLIDCAFLLRINFLGSQKRAAFHRAHPSDVYVLPKRPSFTGKGTDATEYAWFVWGPGRGGRWSMLDVP